ncbi:MAG: NTP transferase domain-containing protein, partial [Patescibacteria group bacterium]|nr:NTP transferase domain-containing protein [Patescibacteria group bacterium]
IMPKTHIIILAGGKGTRMNADFPKVLFKIKEKPMIGYLLEKVVRICEKPTIIIGYKGEDVIQETDNKYHYVWQKEQLGTGHAVMCAKSELSKLDSDNIVVLLGDMPLVSCDTIQQMVGMHEENHSAITISTVNSPNFEGDFNRFYHYGRVVRNQEGDVEKIVELKDADDDQKKIKEVNTSYYCFNAKWLWENIEKLKNENVAKEYYLTDMIGMAVAQNQRVGSFVIKNPVEGFGVNSIEESKVIERYLA